MSSFEIRDDENGIGKVLILKGDWTDEVQSYMEAHNIFALRLTNSFGFNGEDISFLSKLTFLRSLEIYCWHAKGLNVIESLPQLEVIGLQCKSAQKINFSNLLNLKVALATWSKGLSSLLKAPSLEKLNVQNYPHEDLIPISSMTKLKELYLTSRKLESLSGIENLHDLEILNLYNCPSLTSLSGTEHCPKLKIEIEACNRVVA